MRRLTSAVGIPGQSLSGEEVKQANLTSCASARTMVYVISAAITIRKWCQKLVVRCKGIHYVDARPRFVHRVILDG